MKRFMTARFATQKLMIVTLMLLGSATVHAQAQAGGVQANIPFSFSAAGKFLPAGQYTLVAGSEQIRIEDAKGRPVAMMLANHASGRSAGATGEVIFHCYRDRCFLEELWSPTELDGRQVLTSKAETNLAKEEKSKYFAVLGQAVSK